MSDGEKETCSAEVNTDYEEAFGTAIALLDECSHQIGALAYKAKTIAKEALAAWGKADREVARLEVVWHEDRKKTVEAGLQAQAAHEEACYFEALSHDLFARYFQEKARRGNNPKAEIEAIFWKAQADIARQKVGHYPTQKDAVQAYEKACAEARAEEDDDAAESQKWEEARTEAQAEAIQKAVSEGSGSSIPNLEVEAEETD